MDQLAHHIFLLLINLSQIRSEKRILEVFTDALANLLEGITVRWTQENEHSRYAFSISTKKHLYGFIVLDGDVIRLGKDILPLLRNAFQMVGLILEKREQDRLLKNEKQHLEELVRERTADIQRVNEDLVREIKERKQAESQRDRLFNYSVEMFSIAGFDGYFKQVNPAFTRILGWKSAELFLKPYLEFVHPDDHERCIAMDVVLRDGKSVTEFENRFRCKDGSYRWLSWNSFPLRDENIVLSVSRDITSQKRAIDLLRDSEERYRILIENAPESILAWDPDTGKFFEANQYALELFGLTKDNFQQYGLQSVSPDYQPSGEESKSTIRHYEMKVLQGHSPVFEWTFKNTECEEILCEVRLIRIPYKERNFIQGIVQDIRRKKQIEEEIFKVKKLESLGLLAGGIAHDFNNLLTAILGNISLAKLISREQEEIQELLNEAETASLRAKELTTQLLTFAKGGLPVRRVVSLRELVMDTASFALRGSNVHCEYVFDDDLWLANVDKGLIGQVVQNLVINASQSMPDGGSIFINGKNRLVADMDDFANEQLIPGRYVHLKIQDQGIGIPPEYLAKIFDPYFTTKNKGSGLGLTICYSIMKKHNGLISVESQFGKGTTFTLFIPATDQMAVEQKEDKLVIKPGKGRILVMDDEEGVRIVVSRILQHIGYTVSTAKDGLEAVEFYRKSLLEGKKFDAVIMDLTIPGGMGGKDTIQELLKIDPSIVAIVSSGYSNDPVMANCEQYGFRDMVSKPYQTDEISQVLDRVLVKAVGSG